MNKVRLFAKSARVRVCVCLLMTLALCLTQLVPYGLATEKVNAAVTTKTLWSGSKSVSGDWSDWTAAISINVNASSLFSEAFQLNVSYDSGSAPVVVFQSWSGGKPWVQINASYNSKGVAYYYYDSIKSQLGTDITKVNQIIIYPNGSDLTVTKVVLAPAESQTINVQLKGLAGNIANNINCGFNWGNAFDCFGDWILDSSDGSPASFEQAWGNPCATKEMIHKISAAGYKAVRFPVTWAQHIDDANDYKVDEAWMSRVKQVVDWIVDEGMYCILNSHHDTASWVRASTANYQQTKDKYEALWTQIGNRFKDYNHKLLFEGFNEISAENAPWGYPGADATQAVNLYNQSFVDAVRATGGYNATRCLLINTYCTSSDGAILDDFVVPTDSAKDSIMVGVHYYPYYYSFDMSEDTHQTAWRENGGQAGIDNTMFALYKHFTSLGIPVLVGEIAAANHENNTADRADYISYFIKQGEKYGVKAFWWDGGGDFKANDTYGYYTGMSLFNRNTMEWVYPEIVQAMMNSSTSVPFDVEGPVRPVVTSEVPVVSETPVTSEAPVVTSEAPEVSETPVTSKAPEVSKTPVTSEVPVVSQTPVTSQAPTDVPDIGKKVVDVKVSQNIGNGVSHNFTITNATSDKIDLSKLKIRYHYTKADNKEQNFCCDCAGISLDVSPYYVSYTSAVKGTFGEGFLDIEFTDKYELGSGNLSVQIRMNNSDWSSYQNFTTGSYDVFYDGKLVDTING